ncbi:ATP-dependent DNA helicase [uncultured Ramlibacter sp.]|uniref:ATP-dependent DNA helicase n=1 Tax=uncultured Ramlibacter sp. TaxID=260755 RepID=UPI00263360C4|nr:ATP-dependent DNA helicase [uncultured Ramlibacter sp.]
MQYVVAVRALCEFTAKQGDLDLRFTPSPSAQEGMAGHLAVAARRRGSYEAEVSLQGEYRELRVRGRADGYDSARNLLEEIKTHRGALERQPANHRALHWAQARVYGWLLCQERGLQEINLALVYYDIGSQDETVFTELHSADALREFFEGLCGRFLDWARQELAHRAARDAALNTLAFPHAQFRTGQRELAEAVYKVAAKGRCLLAQAPTGIGKTVGTLFPLLKAMPGQGLDKIFYLAAKTPGRQLALDAAQRIVAATPQMPLRVLELTAREKACEHPDKACHGDSCPLAQGFYDRLPAARAAALRCGPMDRPALREAALQHSVCPYYLGQELARWADLVVGDYNYWFDSSAMLHAMAQANEWKAGLLVDEAHNLVDRARGMYTAQLHQGALRGLRQTAPGALKKPLDKLNRAWNALLKDQDQPYLTHGEIPDSLLLALQQAGAAIADWLAEAPAEPAPALQQFFFDIAQFMRLAEAFGSHSLFDTTLEQDGRGKPASILCIRNLIPAPFLAPRFAAAQSATLFSATLSPVDFYRDTLGLPESTATIDVASPFDARQLSVQLVRSISTRFNDRQRSAQPIADLIARQYALQPGNYLAFFSSFDYLQMVSSLFAQQHPDVPMWEQSRRMAEPERQAFLARFEAGGRGIGFAVLGGSFAEGIDLPGDRLVGAFIATLGLPQVNAVNEQMKERMAQAFGAGYDYTYLFPGIQKVVQAAGRVIRTREDKGIVYLIDDRFGRSEVQRLLPAWWGLQPANTMQTGL